MTFSEYIQLKERAEAVGIEDDKTLVRLLHYLQFQEVATRHFESYMNEMDTYCQNAAKVIESQIEDAEKASRVYLDNLTETVKGY